MFTGFGLTRDRDRRNQFPLKGLEVVRASKDDCIEEFRHYDISELYQSSFCAASTEKDLRKHASCSGDSGGPFFAKDASGSFVVFGVLRGGTYFFDCEGMGTTVFVPSYQNWIQDTFRQNS